MDMPSALPVVDESIDNVGSSTWSYIKRHQAYWIVPLVIIIGSTVFFILARILDPRIYILPWLVLLVSYNRAHQKIQHEFMEQFAAANGFSYGAKGSVVGLDGSIFQIGRDRSVVDVINGKFQNYPISLFTYSYVTGYGKSERRHGYTIYELQFDITMPDMLLENAGYIFDEPLFGKVSGKEHIQLEGDFNKYFSLSITKGYEIEALEVFTPDVMAELIDKAKMFSFEIVNGHLFIYDYTIIGTKQALYDIYGLAQYCIEKLGPVLARMKSS